MPRSERPRPDRPCPAPSRRLVAVGLFAVALAPPAARAQGARSSSTVDTGPGELRPGQFVWTPQLAPAGPLVMVVSLEAQRAYVYRNGVRIGASTVSTGMKGHRTPTGVFTILQKKKDHRSNLYNNAPMPFMQRLTWDGIALHAGALPGYPASHGCVRLPMAFARSLYDETRLGMTVVVTDGDPHPEDLEGAHILAPVTDKGKAEAGEARLARGEPYRWRPEAAPKGPLTLVLSAKDRRLLALRNGKEIGRSKCRLPEDLIAGTHALQFTGFDAMMDPRWIHIGLPGRESKTGKPLDLQGAAMVELPKGFRQAVRSALNLGDTLVVTDGGILAGGAGKAITVITS